jgi:type I restriction enzyme S subunit
MSKGVPVKFLYRVIDERGGERSGLPLMSVSLTRGVVPRSDISEGKGRADDLSNYKVCQPGDIVINRMSAYQGALGLSHQEGLVSPDYLVLRPNENVSASYLTYMFKSRWFVGEMTRRLRGIGSIEQGNVRTPRINSDDLGLISIVLPSSTGQQAIADFLDIETTRIDGLIERKLRFVDLLINRQAEFERSVVVGLLSTSPVAPVKTGNPLIPCIPNDWKLVRARFLCSIDTGSSDTDESVDAGEYPFFVRSQTPNLSNRFIFDTEAVLTAGDGAGVGKVFHHFEGKFDAHQRVYVMHNFKGITGRFFFYFFSSYFGIAALDGSAKSTVDSVRRHMISELPVVVPPIEEQVRLAGILDESRGKMESTVVLLRKQVIRLRERREALITAAVTGEIEIREVAA